MKSIPQNGENFKTQTGAPSKEPEGCGLELPLDDCPARRIGCRNHYEMLKFMMPPWAVREYIRHSMSTDLEVRAWLARLDAVLPGQRKQRGGW